MSEVRRLSMPTMLSFGFGNIAEGIKSTAYGAFLLFFYLHVLPWPYPCFRMRSQTHSSASFQTAFRPDGADATP